MGRYAGSIALAVLLAASPATPAPGGVRQSPAEEYVPDALDRLPRGYVVHRAALAPVIDGRLDEEAWTAAAWSEDFVDIASGPAPSLRTRFRMLWDDVFLYVGVELEDPHVRAVARERDTVVHQLDSNIELFLDPDGDGHKYVEIQVNATGTVFDLLLPRPYKDGGFALHRWDLREMRVGTHVDGTVDDPGDRDRGWSIELAVPWARGFDDFAHTTVPPLDGDTWRVNLSRVQWPLTVVEGEYGRPPGATEDNWVWTPQGVANMHRPETWGLVTFRDRIAAGGGAAPEAEPVPIDPAQAARALLHRVYYAQRAYRASHGVYAETLAVLRMAEADLLALGNRIAALAPGIAVPVPGSLRVATTPNAFEASVEVASRGTTLRWHIREDARFWRIR